MISLTKELSVNKWNINKHEEKVSDDKRWIFTLWERQRMEYTSNTRNLRRLHRRGNVDVEYTLILRWKLFTRWTDTFQRRIHVDSTSKFTPRLVKWILTSNRRRFYVEKYPCRRGIFSRDLTSIQRWSLPIHKDCRFINVEYTSIPRQCYTHGIRQFFNVECTSIQRWYFPINRTCRFFDVEYTATPS